MRLNFFGLIQGKRFTGYILALGFFSLSFACFGQSENLSRGGRFSADIVVGCAPMTINITELDNFGNIARQYIHETDSLTNSTTYTYLNPGVYEIIQVIQNQDPRTDTLTITVHPPEPPQVQAANCRDFSASVRTPVGPYDYYWVYYTPTDSVLVTAGEYASPYNFGVSDDFDVRVKGFYNNGNDSCGETQLTISTRQSLTQPTLNTIETFADNTMLLSASFNPGISYVLEVSENAGAFSEIPLVFQGSQILVDQLNPSGSSYCFRLAAYDPCNDEYYYSNELCQVSLSVEFEQFRNNLTWSPPSGSATAYEITRNGASLVQANGSVSSFADSSLVCNTDYCYQVRIDYATGSAVSQEICGTSFEEQSLGPITGIYATYQQDELLVSWEMSQPVALRQFELLYSADGNNLSSHSFTSADNLETFGQQEFLRNSYLYTVSYSDECGNESPPGPVVQPVFLTARKSENNNYDLSWNQYIPLSDGVRQYFVELWGENMELISTLPAWDPGIFSLRLSTDLAAVAWVTVRAEGLGADAGFNSTSNRVPIEFITDLYIPTAFTPNGDGLNDELQVVGIGVSDFFFSIYNRWGEMVFATEDQSMGWDGSFNGKPAPQGSYHYLVEGRDERGNMIKKSGNFVLLRN